MTKNIITLLWCITFWNSFILAQNVYAWNNSNTIYFDNNNPDLLNVEIGCTNTKMTKFLECQSFASLRKNYNNGITIQDKIVRSGMKAFTFVNAPGDCGWDDSKDGKHSDCIRDRERTEISMEQFAKNGVKWAKFSIYIPHKTNCTRGVSCSLWQLHTRHGGPAYMLRWRANRLTMSDFPNAEFAGPFEHIISKDVKGLKGKWLDFVVYIQKYDRPKKGKLKIWLNGKKVVDHFGYRKNLSGKNNYMKFGIYKSWISRAQEVRKPMKLHFDSVTIAYNCKNLNLKKEGYDCKFFN